MGTGGCLHKGAESRVASSMRQRSKTTERIAMMTSARRFALLMAIMLSTMMQVRMVVV